MHPVIQRDSVNALSRGKDSVPFCPRFFVLLLLVILRLRLFALVIFLETIPDFPAVGILHQTRDIPRQLQLFRQKVSGSPQEPLPVHRRASCIKVFAGLVQHGTADLLHRLRAICARMPLQTANSLQQKVHGTEFGDKKVKINIQRLLQHLGADHNQAIALVRRGTFAQKAHQCLFFLGPVRLQKLRMKQDDRIFWQNLS